MAQQDRVHPELVAHEEQVHVAQRWSEAGNLGVTRRGDTNGVREVHRHRREELIQARIPPAENDSGRIETLPDGSISIPLFEERLVVTRQTVLRERIIIRKELATEWRTVKEELRRERIDFDTAHLPDGSVYRDRPTGDAVRAETRPFFVTSEFAALVLALIAVVVTASLSDAFGVGGAAVTATILIAAYTLGRGFAKTGS